MKNLPRILMFLGAILLFGVFFFPIWRISLYAPQYPNGLSMYIWVDQLTDVNALKNINILNHYVGMQMIEPDSIPELKIFPYVIYALAALALIAAFIDKKKVYLMFFVIIVLTGLAGMYDFYTWLYDYGHNLSPEAPIKVPGQSYQPPLLGSKWLLNFYAESYPHTGAIFFGLPMLLSALAFWFKKSIKKG